MADSPKKSGGWNWAYVIPLAALMIPIIGVLGPETIAEIFTGTPAIILTSIAGGTLAGRYLLGYRHRLRLDEIEARAAIVDAETRQLAESTRLLDLDDPVNQLRSKIDPPATEA